MWDLFKNTDSSSNETSEVFMTESLNQSFKPIFHNFNIKKNVLCIYMYMCVYSIQIKRF